MSFQPALFLLLNTDYGGPAVNFFIKNSEKKVLTCKIDESSVAGLINTPITKGITLALCVSCPQLAVLVSWTFVVSVQWRQLILSFCMYLWCTGPLSAYGASGSVRMSVFASISHFCPLFLSSSSGYWIVANKESHEEKQLPKRTSSSHRNYHVSPSN